jgi:cytochrome c-type biogenesis protein CcmF
LRYRTSRAGQGSTHAEDEAMIAEFGHYALVLALGLALVQACVPILGARRNDAALMAVAEPTAIAQFCFVAIAFAALTVCYVRSDFSVVNVFENSHSAKPLIYKISGVWGNHEGSMLLWVLILSTFGALVALLGGNLPARLRANVLGVQSWIAVAFDLFILVTSNPFLRIDEPPFEGRDLNPILQDPGLAIHPPLLYLGYVGLSISFSFAIAALIDGRIDAAWARWVRPWTLLAWMFLTLGIAMGSYWAYYTLGWGGWWFWDPVENASFMPWLAATALLHSALVMEKRDALKVWTILLAILAFSLSLIGTFLVRSGVLTSVHAFANDPTRGVFILAILVLFIGGALVLFALRAPLLKQGGLFAPISREGALVLNNLFLVSACATVFTGTLYPLALEAVTGQKISVGAPFFNGTFGPLFVALLIAVPFGPLLAWKRGDLAGVAQRLVGAAAIAAIAVAVVFAMEGGGPILMPFAIGLAVFVMTGALTEIVERTGLLRVPFATALLRAKGLPRSTWGAAFAHFGLGITLLGVIGETQWSLERIAELKPGQTMSIRRYELGFDGVSSRQGPNYRELAAHFTVRRQGDVIGIMEPAKRSFPSRGTATTETALLTRGFSQLYLSLGEPNADGSITVRLYYKPLVLLIWLGAIVMVLGGALSLSDRRLRVGAPTPARSKAALAPAE